MIGPRSTQGPLAAVTDKRHGPAAFAVSFGELLQGENEVVATVFAIGDDILDGALTI